jgi:hypothetical protein
MFGIKMRRRGANAWLFVGSEGFGVRLKIHACRWESETEAQNQSVFFAAANADLEFKVVSLQAT